MMIHCRKLFNKDLSSGHEESNKNKQRPVVNSENGEPPPGTASSGQKSQNVLMEEDIKRIAGGDRDALADLYARASTAIYGYSLSILRNTTDAEDILQDAFVKIWFGAGKYTPQGKPMAWMMTIARNLCMDKLRHDRRSTALPEDEYQHIYADSPSVTSDDKLMLEAAINTLADDERQIVMLHAVTGFKHIEIAKMFGMPLMTVISKYNRAKQKLRKYLERGETA